LALPLSPLKNNQTYPFPMPPKEKSLLKIKKTPKPLPLNILPTHLWKGGEKEKKNHPPPSHPTPPKKQLLGNIGEKPNPTLPFTQILSYNLIPLHFTPSHPTLERRKPRHVTLSIKLTFNSLPFIRTQNEFL